ncbi:MAG: hybrid sensor histidine kinase/response regulator [bacterium]|nr:hybrid sensor histidine kinase/response regulator [bacterium]
MMTPGDTASPMLNLLIVDDREANLLSLSQLLARDDVRIFTALSGNEALGLLLEHDFALVLLDVQMPGMDGFEVATLMRGHERTRHVPLIFVTAISKDRQHIFSGYDSGAVDYLFKPLDPHVIRSKVAVFLELKRSQLARERLLDSLSRANAQLEEASLVKSDCLAAASHELRTPLTAMKEFCSLVHDEVVGPLNPEQKRCLETALRNCRRLGGIVEHLMDLDSLESGRLRVRRGRVDVGEIVRTAAAAYSARCRTAGQKLELSVPPCPRDAEALADPELVAGVLAQLLDNAHRFSPSGGTIRLRVRRLDGRASPSRSATRGRESNPRIASGSSSSTDRWTGGMVPEPRAWALASRSPRACSNCRKVAWTLSARRVGDPSSDSRLPPIPNRLTCAPSAATVCVNPRVAGSPVAWSWSPTVPAPPCRTGWNRRRSGRRPVRTNAGERCRFTAGPPWLRSSASRIRARQAGSPAWCSRSRLPVPRRA